jgi:uncharacterized Zn finger protein (UPF0148 family)
MGNCLVCGKKISDDEKFCDNCANVIHPKPPTCPVCGMEIEKGETECPNCEVRIDIMSGKAVQEKEVNKEEMEEAVEDLMLMPGITRESAEQLYRAGFNKFSTFLEQTTNVKDPAIARRLTRKFMMGIVKQEIEKEEFKGGGECPICGAPVNADAKRCDICGANIEGTVVVEQPEAEAPPDIDEPEAAPAAAPTPVSAEEAEQMQKDIKEIKIEEMDEEEVATGVMDDDILANLPADMVANIQAIFHSTDSVGIDTEDVGLLKNMGIDIDAIDDFDLGPPPMAGDTAAETGEQPAAEEPAMEAAQEDLPEEAPPEMGTAPEEAVEEDPHDDMLELTLKHPPEEEDVVPAAAEDVATEDAPSQEMAPAQEAAEEDTVPAEEVAEPVPEEAITEEEAIGEAAADEMPVDEPAAEEPAVEEPPAEETATEEPAVEEPAVEEPPAEEMATEEPAVEEPTVEEPPAEEMATEEPAVEEPTVEDIPVEEPAAEEPVSEEPIVEEPVEETTPEEAAEESIVEEPVVDAHTLFNNLKSELKQAKPLLIKANKLGFDVSGSKGFIEEAMKAGRDRQFERAISIVMEIKTQLTDAIDSELGEGSAQKIIDSAMTAAPKRVAVKKKD